MICGAPPPNRISQLVVRTRNMIHSDSWLKHLNISGAGGTVCPRQAARTIPEPYNPRTTIFTREVGTLIFMNSSMQPAWMVPSLRTSPWRRRCRTLPITTLLLATRRQLSYAEVHVKVGKSQLWDQHVRREGPMVTDISSTWPRLSARIIGVPSDWREK